MTIQNTIVTPPITPPPITPAAQPRATVLLVEDDRSIRRYLEVTLQRAGYTVIAVADGLEAMKAALSSQIDAVITDAIMPRLNGYELCRFLRHNPKLSRVPVVLLSGIDQAAQSGEGGGHADAYLSKPVRPEELTECVARLLAREG
ncbi:MAG: response regulator [Pyrinomonadaceae bacterium]